MNNNSSYPPMTSNNVSNISSIQLIFSELAQNNNEALPLSATSTQHSPVPPTIHPTPHPPVPKPVRKTPQPSENKPADPNEIPSATADVLDYSIWSVINVFAGGIVLGIPSVILSIITRKYKRQGNVKVAKTLSTITLAYNIFVSFLAMIGVVYLITHFNNPY